MGWVLLSMAVIVVWRRRGRVRGGLRDFVWRAWQGMRGRIPRLGGQAGHSAVIGQSFHEKLHETKSRQPEPRGRTRDANIDKVKYMEITVDKQLHKENSLACLFINFLGSVCLGVPARRESEL